MIPDTPPLNSGVCTLVRIEHVSLLVVEASDCGRVAGKVGFADHIGVVEGGVDVRGRDDTLGDEALNVMELDMLMWRVLRDLDGACAMEIAASLSS